MIKVTEQAVKEVKKVLEEQKMELDKHVLRVGILSGGCAGMQYDLKFDELKNVDKTKDFISEQHGITVVVDKKSDLYLDGTTVDFYSDLNKRGFTFNNPQVKPGGSCGCNKSFQI